ncbi:D-glycero-alpha-D-manno-heptose-1,7-bisphosphate 7-phosphatase [Metabacillus sp. RGM 3146]|uniref:D-glycero-alpha-D-manno-heptose-1,7-bisphosphate 7-phosphatase n=1 Tax=Metabacillus sp. RGM 3146 TaxID=3401092 RepID=UPI003B9B29C9
MKKGVFLDRDGVINEVMTERVKYVNKPQDLFFLDGALDAIRLLTESGYDIFIITNQGGVGLGYLKESVLQAIHAKMLKEIENSGGRITEVVYCPHAPYSGCSCRKPEPLLLLNLIEKYKLTANDTFMIGDRETDIEAGKRAGTRTILIGDNPGIGDFQFSSLVHAAKWIVKEG